jgi:hypothetical protein
MKMWQLRREIRRRIVKIDKLMFAAFQDGKREMPALAGKKWAYTNVLRLTYEKR